MFFRVPKLLSHSFFFRVPFDKVTIFLLIIQYSARIKIRSVLGRKYYIRIPLFIVFYPLISWSWNFENCKFTVLSLQSKRKILIWSTIGRIIPSLRKKEFYGKSSSSQKNSYYSLPLWKIPKVAFPLTKEPPWFQQSFSPILQTEKCFKIVRSIRSFNFQGSIWNSTEVEPRDRAKFWKKIWKNWIYSMFGRIIRNLIRK